MDALTTTKNTREIIVENAEKRKKENQNMVK